MRHTMDEARHHAVNTINEVNRHLRSGKVTNPRHHETLTNMMNAAMDTLETIDRMNDRQAYRGTNTGYNDDNQQNRQTYDNRTYNDRTYNDRGYNDRQNDTRNDSEQWNAINAAMDLINRTMDRVNDDVVNRRGDGRRRQRVRGYTRRRPGATMMDVNYVSDTYDDDMDYTNRYQNDYSDYNDYDDDYSDVLDARRGGRAGRVRVSGYTRRRPRADMDDKYTADDRYYNRTDMRYDDRRSDDVARAAADAAAETARRMTNTRNDRGDVYPHHIPPVMPATYDRYSDRHDDAMRADTNIDDRRTAETRTSDIGPSPSRMRR